MQVTTMSISITAGRQLSLGGNSFGYKEWQRDNLGNFFFLKINFWAGLWLGLLGGVLICL
jgi:hypothetical protein